MSTVTEQFDQHVATIISLRADGARWSKLRDELRQLQPAVQANNAAFSACDKLLPAVVAGASPRACELAHNLSQVRATWTPEELVPLPDSRAGLPTLLKIMAYTVPPAMLAVVWFTVSHWWLLLAVPAAYVASILLRIESRDIARRRDIQARNATQDLYARASRLQTELKLEHVQAIESVLVKALAARHVALAAASAAERARLAKLAASYAAEASFSSANNNSNYASSGSSNSAGYGTSMISSADSYSTDDDYYYPEYSQGAYDSSSTWGDVNPGNGLPMIADTPIDVCGHVYGSAE